MFYFKILMNVPLVCALKILSATTPMDHFHAVVRKVFKEMARSARVRDYLLFLPGSFSSYRYIGFGMFWYVRENKGKGRDIPSPSFGICQFG